MDLNAVYKKTQKGQEEMAQRTVLGMRERTLLVMGWGAARNLTPSSESERRTILQSYMTRSTRITKRMRCISLASDRNGLSQPLRSTSFAPVVDISLIRQGREMVVPSK